MSQMLEATPVELRRLLHEELHPRRLLLRRDHGGAISLRILSEAFEDAEDPLAVVQGALAVHDRRLPERTLTILKAPAELEDEEEENLYFPQGWPGTPNWADALLREPDDPCEPDDRSFDAEVVAFWGVKGGVGRSTALAHVADILGQRKRVLALDLDLESPALVAMLTNGTPLRSGVPRLEDLVRGAASKETLNNDLRRLIQQALRQPSSARSTIDLLGPSHADKSYVLSLLGPLAPASLYRGGRPALRRLVRQAILATEAELVLLDARSGYCDESAIAALDLADTVVLFASPAPSTFPSLLPAMEALERNRQAIGRPKAVYIVAGMLPAGEEARERIVDDLRSTLEDAQVQIAESLGTSDDDLPPEISIITVDYSARIVENEGTLLPNASDGYREIAERICPAPASTNLSRIQEGWVNDVLREARVPMTQAEDENDPRKLAELFTRTPDLTTFARQDVCLVLGAKGTGKSFLRRMCLDQQDLLVERSGVRSLSDVTFIDGYSQPRGGRVRQPPITPDLLRILDQKLGDRWRDVWSALAFGRVAGNLGDQVSQILRGHNRTQIQQILRLAKAEASKKILVEVERLLKDPLGLDDAWLELDRWCEEAGRTFILLFDDLDIALGETTEDLERRGEMVRGLLDRANASWMSRRHLGVKIFLREDIFRSLGTQEEAKYASRSINLHWRPEDMWRLIIRAMAVASSTFRDHLGIDVHRLEETPEEDWSDALELIWGERLGTSESQTRSRVWAQRRLRDSAGGRMFPRAALWLLHYSIQERRSSLSRHSKPPLLDGRSLRRAMPNVAKERLAELRAESSQEEKRRLQRLKGLKAYQNESEFLEALERAGEADPAEALVVFKRLGIAESGRRRDSTPTVRIVDLYAFAPELEIDRRGRR